MCLIAHIYLGEQYKLLHVSNDNPYLRLMNDMRMFVVPAVSDLSVTDCVISEGFFPATKRLITFWSTKHLLVVY